MAQRKLKSPFKITKTIVERFECLDRSDIGCYGVILPHCPTDPLVYENKPIAEKAYAYLKKLWKIDD